MSSDRRIRASRANGALSNGPKTQPGKDRSRLNGVKHRAFAKSLILANESPQMLAKLRAEYFALLKPKTCIERDLIEEMVIAKCLSRRSWGLESTSVNYKMDQQAADVAARHTRIQEPTRSAIAHKDLYDNSSALAQIQRAQARNSRAYHRALNTFNALRVAPQIKNDQPNLVPDSDTTPPTGINHLHSISRRMRRALRRLIADPPQADEKANQHSPTALDSAKPGGCRPLIGTGPHANASSLKASAPARYAEMRTCARVLRSRLPAPYKGRVSAWRARSRIHCPSEEKTGKHGGTRGQSTPSPGFAGRISPSKPSSS